MATNIKLSILIATVPSRVDFFFPRIIKQLQQQVGTRKDIEIVGLFDNKTRSIGLKRQELMNMARGTYLTFIDDDDRLADDYISSIMKAIEHDAVGSDCIVYNTICTVSGGRPKLCKYGIEFNYGDILDGAEWRGKPAHTMVWRSAIAKQTAFNDMGHGEDINWVWRAYGGIKNQYRIDRVLYYYDAEPKKTSECYNLPEDVIAANVAALKAANSQ